MNHHLKHNITIFMSSWIVLHFTSNQQTNVMLQTDTWYFNTRWKVPGTIFTY